MGNRNAFDFKIENFKEPEPIGRFAIPKATLGVNRSIGFNEAAVRRFRLREYQYINLLYDSKDRVIALKLSNERSENSIKLRVEEKRGVASARRFLTYFDIDTTENISYDLRKDEETGILWIHLT